MTELLKTSNQKSFTTELTELHRVNRVKENNINKIFGFVFTPCNSVNPSTLLRALRLSKGSVVQYYFWIFVLLAGLTAPLAAQTPVPTETNAWNYAAFQAAFKAGGRTTTLTEAKFDAVQVQKSKAYDYLQKYLDGKFGKANPAVLSGFKQLPREYYHYNYEKGKDFCSTAYDIPAHPWAIGYGSALSDYPGQAYMIQLANPKPTDVALEIGTGSGYNISLLSKTVKEAYSIEIIQPLGEAVSNIFAPLKLTNIHTRVGDGFFGWPEVTGGFDLIIVTCAAQYVPPDLLKQLKPHGRMIIPIGQPFRGHQVLYVYMKDADGKVHSKKDMGVFFIPMTGQMQKGKK
jgi:protein-L-isoaspartate(D-aspartate) O-methyltransferase